MNFEAIIKATLDTAQAKSQLDAFIQNAQKPITIPVNFGKQGGQAGRNFADAFQSSLNKIDLKNGGIGNVRRMLQGAGFDTSSISLVTKELDKMSLSISKIQTKQLQNGNIRMNITGVDELQRGVTIVREFDKETGKVANTSKTFTQTFAESISKAQTKVQQFNQLQAEAFGNQMSAWASDNSKAFNAYSTELGNLYTRLQTAISSKDGNAVKQIQEEFKLLQSEAKATGNIGNEVAKQFTTSLNSIKIDTFDKQITAWSRNNSKAMNAMMESTTTTYGEQIAEYHRQIQQLQNDITNSPTGITEAHVNRFREIQDGMRNLQAEAKATGNVGKSFGEQFTSAFGSMAKFAASYVSIRQVFNTIRDGIKTVNELDDALVDLQKTTTATPQQLSKFYGEANDIAKQYGTTTKQIIQGAADWSRLGYNIEDATTMSKLSSQFAAISPGMSVDESTTSLVSAMKAFGVSADEVLDGVMSKVNKVGNSFALSNADIMTALKNSSSAMAVANNSLDETIALITAGTEIVQDASKVGNGLRTISMRIRGMNEETESLDDSLVTIKGDVFDLTNGKVSIMEDADTYKSTYQVLKEISAVWDELTDKQQAQLLDKLFGKTRAQIGASIISNFAQAEKAMQTMATSAGAADKEMEIITQSLTYKLNALVETGTGIFQNLFQREDMGAVIDMLTGVLSVVDAFTEKFGLMGTVLASGAIAMGIINIASAIRQLHAEGQVVTSIGLLTKLFPKLEDGILNAYTSGQGLLGVLSAMTPVLVPLGIAIGAVTAAFAGFKAFDYKNSGWTRSQEAATKAVDDYQKAQDKLKSLEDTQTSNLESAKEIAAKYNIDVEGVETVDEVIAKIEASDTGITLVDEAELHKLSNANTDLETQIKLQRQLANTQKKTMETATEESAKAQKSFWEVVKERHSGGFFGTIAAGWDYIKSNFGGHSTFIDDEGNEHIYKSEGDRWREIGGAAGATNLELAKNAFEEYKKAKQDLETLDNQLLAQDEDATQNQLATRKQLVDNLQEKTESMTGYMDTLTQQTETLASVDSDFARDQVKQARQLFLDFENFGLSKPEAALNSLTHFFDGSAGTNAIKDTLREAAEEGKNLEDVLASMGLTLEDLNLGKDGLEYLNKYFADASKSAQEAKETVDDFRVSASDVEEATKSANRDKDWTTIQAAYKSAKELLAEGKTGVDDFQTVAQFFSPKNLGLLAQKAKDAGGYASDVYQQAFEDAQAKADRWFGENEAQSLMNFADDMQSKGMFTIDKSDEKGLWDIQSNFKNTAEAANEMGISVQAVEALLSGLEAYGYDFSGIEKSGELIEQYATSLDALKVAYDQMEEGAAKDRLGGLIQQFDDEYAKLGEDLSNLSEEQVIRLKFEYDLATLQNDITDLQNNINNGDNSVSNYAGLISLNDKYIQKSKEELGNVELPVEYKISEESEAQLKEQLSGKNGEEKLELQAEITNQQEIQKGILDELNAEKPIIEPEVNSDKVKEEVNSATEDAEATVTANVEGKEEVEELNESKEKAGKDENANVSVSTSGEGEVKSLADNAEKAGSDKTGTVTVETEGEDKVEELADSTEKATNGNTINLSINIAGKEDYDSIVDKDVAINANVEVSGKDEYDSVSDKSVTISANVQMTGGDDKVADKKATVKYSKDSSVADSYQPSDKEATVKYGKDSSIPDGYQPSDKHATVYYSANTSGLPNSFPTITRYVNYVKTGAVVVDGTAHVDGTAFASGNWGTKSDGVALGGELGREIVVRGGRFFTIGDTGAEFFSYKKGDVIFNAEQSKQILEKGKITHGARRGRALASGTAFIEGNAFRFSTTQGNDGSSNSSSGSKHSSKHSSDKSSSKKKSSKSKSSDKDDDDSTKIDWIEVAIDRAERAIKKLKTIADSVYKTFKDRNQSIQKDIKKTTEEISLQEKAYARYEKEFRKAASEGKLATATINKIKDGTIDITKYNKDQQKAITEAKKWYDKALDAKDAIDKLKESVSALAKQRFDNVVKAWSNSFQDAEHAADRLEEKIKNTTSTASDYISLTDNKYTSSTTNNINDYKDLIKNYRNQRDRRLFKVQDLKHKLDEVVKSGNIAVGSEAYYQMLKQIQSVEDEIDELNGKIIESSNSLAEQYKIAFDRVADLAENKKQELDHKANEYNNYLELAEAKGLQTSATYYKRLKSIEEKNLQNAKKLATDLQKQLNNALKSGKIKICSQAWYDMSQRIYEAREAIQESTLAIANFDNQIRQVAWDKFDYLQDRISSVTDEASFLIDLMENDKLFNDKGQITGKGLSVLGLYATNYDVYMNQADQYAKEIKKINKEIAKDPANTNLIERKTELVKAQQQSIKAAEQEKKSIKSLVSEGIKVELSYIKELINKYNDAVTAQKDLYDYQKKVRDQTSDIASLQKQLSAYANDTSEEARAKIQQIQVNLKAKQEELEETEYERMISDSKKLLDDFYNEYEKALNSRLDNIDQLLVDAIATANDNSAKISKTISNEAKSVGYTLSEEIKNIWNRDSVDPILSPYFKDYSSALTTVNSTLSNISTYVSGLLSAANAQAQKDTDAVNKETTNKNESEKKAATPAPKKSSGGTSGKASTPASTPAKAKTPGSSYTGLWKDGNSTYYYVKGKKQTGWKSMNEGRRYFSVKDGKMLVGEQVIGGKRFYFDKTKGILKKGTFIADGNYYNTDKNGVIIFKSKRDAGTSNPNGIANTTSLIKAKGYASGAKRISRNQLAWTNEGSGLETIVRASDKAVLTKVSRDSRIYNAMASENLWQAANNPEKFISQHTGLILTSGSLHSGGNVNQTFDNVNFVMPNVKNYTEILEQMQKDRNFEKLVQAMTIAQLNGKTSAAKRHVNVSKK